MAWRVVRGDSAGFGSVAEALRAGVAFADYLTPPMPPSWRPPRSVRRWCRLGEIQTKLAVAYAEFLFRFDAHDAHDADGYATPPRGSRR